MKNLIKNILKEDIKSKYIKKIEYLFEDLGGIDGMVWKEYSTFKEEGYIVNDLLSEREFNDINCGDVDKKYMTYLFAETEYNDPMLGIVIDKCSDKVDVEFYWGDANHSLYDKMNTYVKVLLLQDLVNYLESKVTE